MSCGVDVGGMVTMANKGGVGVSVCVGDTSLCCIGAHLNAHDEKVERRNEDFVDERKHRPDKKSKSIFVLDACDNAFFVCCCHYFVTVKAINPT